MSLIPQPSSSIRTNRVPRKSFAFKATRKASAHGRLPSPFLRELEILLSEGVLKVIVASPTLSQGLNLNAAVLLVPALIARPRR